MSKQWTRRKFIKSLGMGAGAALLANAGLPAVVAQDRKFQNDILQQTGSSFTPDVELLCGDVTGFQLKGQWEGGFGSVTFRTHQAWHNGNSVYYIRTDASDQQFALDNRLVFVPLLNATLAAEGSTGQLYTFETGAADQYPVVSHIPSDEAYSPAWQVHRVTFSGEPQVLTSVEDIQAAADAGDVTIEALQLVVNHPIVKWTDGELPVDTDLTSYLGTGPLLSAHDDELMSVTFKLHQCYPGSRYIVTDTSAPPMAEGMNLAASPPTSALVGVGATDEIWVFGNGIPGTGVMGFQPAIFDNAAGNPVWSPFWDHFTAVWADESQAELVTNSTRLRELVDQGALEIFNGTPNSHPTGFVVNCPVPIKSANDFQV